MGNQELQRTLDSMQNVRQELSTSNEKALAFLIEAGILSQDGEPIHPDALA
jgi:hypothetical protein